MNTFCRRKKVRYLSGNEFSPIGVKQNPTQTLQRGRTTDVDVVVACTVLQLRRHYGAPATSQFHPAWDTANRLVKALRACQVGSRLLRFAESSERASQNALI